MAVNGRPDRRIPAGRTRTSDGAGDGQAARSRSTDARSAGGRVTGGRQLVVNPIACDAHGICAELLPELIRLDEWGYPIIDDRPIPHHLDALARRAVSACPTLALLIRDVPVQVPHKRS